LQKINDLGDYSIDRKDLAMCGEDFLGFGEALAKERFENL
jgi:hypothetical protein